MKRLFLAMILLAASSPAWAWSSTSCPAGTIDMVGYMTPQPGYSTVHQHGMSAAGVDLPRYSNMWSNLIVETNQDVGYPWDIFSYDDNYVYWYLTGVDGTWTDPTTFTEMFYNTNKMTPRCAPTGSPGWSSGAQSPQMKVINPGCVLASTVTWPTQSEVWGPYYLPASGDVPANAPTMVIANYWGTKDAGGHWPVKEMFYYTEGFGLIAWQSYSWNGASYVLTYDSHLDHQAQGGMPAYVFPCTP